jgi:isopropylmalate/homocitrate/citramalate synthase
MKSEMRVSEAAIILSMMATTGNRDPHEAEKLFKKFARQFPQFVDLTKMVYHDEFGVYMGEL